MKKDAAAKQIRPPSWLSRPEKRSFLAEIRRQSAGNRRLSASQTDAVADYVSARSRLAVLQKLWRDSLADAGEFTSEKVFLMKLARQIDSATAICARLAKAVDEAASTKRRAVTKR
jgi:hypothetical protein